MRVGRSEETTSLGAGIDGTRKLFAQGVASVQKNQKTILNLNSSAGSHSKYCVRAWAAYLKNDDAHLEALDGHVTRREGLVARRESALGFAPLSMQSMET
ncbi:hypothetical protein CRM22_007532 [Opisthorchis felineus]|uniref:Uncharacterized protein n=1 Tax=Opisthorchis felineus TaxID=147828 RepID=A0A4S2LNB1_OPIFE|nr:hypothetical protein CRM22_007532 [Opisthorchis felineus]